MLFVMNAAKEFAKLYEDDRIVEKHRKSIVPFSDKDLSALPSDAKISLREILSLDIEGEGTLEPGSNSAISRFILGNPYIATTLVNLKKFNSFLNKGDFSDEKKVQKQLRALQAEVTDPQAELKKEISSSSLTQTSKHLLEFTSELGEAKQGPTAIKIRALFSGPIPSKRGKPGSNLTITMSGTESPKTSAESKVTEVESPKPESANPPVTSSLGQGQENPLAQQLPVVTHTQHGPVPNASLWGPTPTQKTPEIVSHQDAQDILFKAIKDDLSCEEPPAISDPKDLSAQFYRNYQPQFPMYQRPITGPQLDLFGPDVAEATSIPPPATYNPQQFQASHELELFQESDQPPRKGKMSKSELEKIQNRQSSYEGAYDYLDRYSGPYRDIAKDQEVMFYLSKGGVQPAMLACVTLLLERQRVTDVQIGEIVTGQQQLTSHISELTNKLGILINERSDKLNPEILNTVKATATKVQFMENKVNALIKGVETMMSDRSSMGSTPSDYSLSLLHMAKGGGTQSGEATALFPPARSGVTKEIYSAPSAPYADKLQLYRAQQQGRPGFQQTSVVTPPTTQYDMRSLPNMSMTSEIPKGPVGGEAVKVDIKRPGAVEQDFPEMYGITKEFWDLCVLHQEILRPLRKEPFQKALSYLYSQRVNQEPHWRSCYDAILQGLKDRQGLQKLVNGMWNEHNLERIIGILRALLHFATN